MERLRDDDQHREFREKVRAFLAEHVSPQIGDWERTGTVDRSVWNEAGAAGLLGVNVPAELGGAGHLDFRYNAVVTEEIAAAGASCLGIPEHNDIVSDYLLRIASPDQQGRWLPAFCRGTLVTAFAGINLDEPDHPVTATRDGEGWILAGRKTFVGNGVHADLILVVARTDAGDSTNGYTLFAVERERAGLKQGAQLDTVGMRGQGIAELEFDKVRVPPENQIGRAGAALKYLLICAAQERLSIALGAVAAARAVFEETRRRHAAGLTGGGFVDPRHVLAEVETEICVAEHFIDRAVIQHIERKFTVRDSAMVKWWTVDLHQRVTNRCMQLLGGPGCVEGNIVSRSYRDATMLAIYGGSRNGMQQIIGLSR